ncbi:MAG: hypothetical protein SAK29_29360, partial [Scytonema sp. PMC 1069.18]|nr:hypothetical protein [Scytonema sp. PMC 1069.18]
YRCSKSTYCYFFSNIVGKHGKDFLVISPVLEIVTIKIRESFNKGQQKMDVKLILIALTIVFIFTSLFFGTKNGFYDSDNYHGNGSAH